MIPTLPYMQKYFYSRFLLANPISIQSQHRLLLQQAAKRDATFCFVHETKERVSFRVGLNTILQVTLKTSGAMSIATTAGTAWSNDPLGQSSSVPAAARDPPNKTKPEAKRHAERAEVQAVCSVVPKHHGMQEKEPASLRGHRSRGFSVVPFKCDQCFCGLPTVYKPFSSLIITRIHRKQ